MSKLPDQDLEALINQFERSDWRELVLRMQDVELVLGKDGEPKIRSVPVTAPAPAQAQLAPTPGAAVIESKPGQAPPALGAASKPIPVGWKQIRAPSLGTFYRAPKPGAPPYVDVDGAVAAETEVCMIEVMKLFTTMRAGVSGVVREVYVSDGELVEFDQPLFLVEPDV